MGIIIGIDVGGSTTKIVGLKDGDIISPLFVRANDPVASAYGAFGKFLSDNAIYLNDIQRVMVTGVGSAYINGSFYGIPTCKLSEFEAIGKGGLFLTGLEQAIILSLGTGTAVVYADKSNCQHLGGTGVGGGTLVGLSKKMLSMHDVDCILSLAEQGDLRNVDLRICDITVSDTVPTLTAETTASNFGGLSDTASNSDIALGILNMVYETAAMLALFAARHKECKNIIITGHLAEAPQAASTFSNLSKIFENDFIIPEHAQYAPSIGAALYGQTD